MANPIKVIGIGPGSQNYLLPVAIEAVARCEVVLGSTRALALFKLVGKETRILDGNLEKALNYLQNRNPEANVGVLVSGDPGFFSLLVYLRRHFPEEELEVIPGISSVQVAFARLGMPWQEARLLSLHGRPLESIIPHLREGQTLGLLVDSRMKSEELAQSLFPYGPFRVHICRNLTYPDETICTLTLEELSQETNLGNAVVVIEPDETA